MGPHENSRSHGRHALAGCLLSVVLVLALIGGVILRHRLDHDTEPIPDDALSAPPGTRLVSDDGGTCSNGADFECGRVFTLLGSGEASLAATRDRVIEFLIEEEGWDGSLRSGSACREGGHYCVDVAAFTEFSLAAPGSRDEQRVASTHRISFEDLPELRSRGVAVSFTDCCGDAWPF